MTDPAPNWQERYDAKHIVTVRVRLSDQPGALARFLQAVAEVGASLGDIRIAGADGQHKIRDVRLFLVDDAHRQVTEQAIAALEGVEILEISDDVLEIHRGGAIETRARVPLDSMMDLRMVYTPGVASVCERIAEDPEAAWAYTGRGNRIAIVTNGTAVLGLGDIGPLAGLPVMEGKSAILAHFANVWADVLLLDRHDANEVIDIVAALAQNYGAIQLEDIAAPACFKIEQQLQERLDIPVFHDDQHGTATVVVAGLINALKQVDRRVAECKVVILGAGAAGTAIARFLVELGAGDVVVCDSVGAIHEGRAERMNPWKSKLAEETNRQRRAGSVEQMLVGANCFIGVSRPNVISTSMIRGMADDPIVFALANPVSEISVAEAIIAGAAVAVDGRAMNNALAYPGIFRGALDARAPRITHAMKVAAAEALAGAATTELLPDMLDLEVHREVARAVKAAAAPGPAVAGSRLT